MLWTNRPISRDNGDTRSSGLATPITAHEKALALQLWNPTHPVLYQILQGASRSRDSRERERERERVAARSRYHHSFIKQVSHSLLETRACCGCHWALQIRPRHDQTKAYESVDNKLTKGASSLRFDQVVTKED